MLPGAHYNDPEFSWKYAIPASPLGFVQGRGLGPQFEGDMFVGAARTFLVGGFLFRFKLTPDRLHFAFTDSRLNDLVADNLDKFDITESESLLIGRDFGSPPILPDRPERPFLRSFKYEWSCVRDFQRAAGCFSRPH